MRDYVGFWAFVLLAIVAAAVQWVIYGDPRCIIAECRIVK